MKRPAHVYSPYLPVVIGGLLVEQAHRVVKVVDRNFVVRATRRLVGGRIPRRGDNISIEVTIGRPNYAERKFIKDCVKAGEPFPVKKLRIQYPPKRRRT